MDLFGQVPGAYPHPGPSGKLAAAILAQPVGSGIAFHIQLGLAWADASHSLRSDACRACEFAFIVRQAANAIRFTMRPPLAWAASWRGPDAPLCTAAAA
jgi:hypothetical protein